MNPEPKRRSAQVLKRLRDENPQLHDTLTFAKELMAMIRQQSTTPLGDWFSQALALGDADLRNMVTNIRIDAAAIQNAMTERCSNGQAEGH